MTDINNTKKNKKFISIIWGYHEHIYSFAPEENYHLHILKVAKELGFDPYMILRHQENIIEKDPNFDKDIKVIYYKNIYQFIYLIIKFSIQKSIFYVNSYEWQSFIVPFLSRKTIFMAHTQPKRQNKFKQKIQNFVYRFFTKIRLNNTEEKHFLFEQKINPLKLEVIPLIVSQKVFYKTNDNIRGKDLVYFGNITAKKDLITILKAFELVKSTVTNIKINIIGNMWDDKVVEFINNSKYKEDIILHGFLPNEILVHKLNENYIYLNSSLDEGQCVAVYDAALCGLGLCLPRIMSFVGVFKDTALFHDLYDYKKLAQNIMYYLEDENILNTHIKNNIDMITRDYSIITIEEKLKKLISNI